MSVLSTEVIELVANVTSRYARRLTWIKDDIVSVGYIAAIEAMRKCPYSNKVPYMIVCIRGAVLDFIKSEIRQKHEGILSEEYLAGHTIEENAELPDSLSETERTVAQMFYRGYRACEIGKQIGVSEATVSRIKKALRGKLKEEGI